MSTIKKERLLLLIIRYAPSIFIIALAIIGLVNITIKHNKDLKKVQSNIKTEYIQLHKERIKKNIATTTKFINDSIQNSNAKLEEELSHRINTVHKIAMNIYLKNKNSLPKKEILRQIKNAVETIRYENGQGYFSIHTLDGINILHPINKNLEGTSVLNRKDVTGKYPVREAINIAKTKGEGFFTWYYFKPNDRSKRVQKSGIVKKFVPYNLIITTALFEDDLQNKVKKEILDGLKNIHFQDNEYIFILDTKGKIVLTKDNIPINTYAQSNLMKLFKEFVREEEKSKYFNYTFYNFDNNEIKEYSKTSYLHKLDSLDWVIGVGFDLDKLNILIQEKKILLDKEISEHFNVILSTAFIISLILLFISILFSKYLEKIFYQYKKQLIEQELIKLELMKEKVDNHEQTITSLVNLIEQRDFYTAGHSQRVASYAVAIAKAMKCTEQEITILNKIGLLHDIGKIAIPDSILLKPGRLSRQEFDIIKEHSQLGYDVISKIPMFKEFSYIILSHHERYDGSGYPNGLKGDQIPLLASILSFADSFDAMTSTRIYNKTRTKEQALALLQKDSGVLFDPRVADVAIEVLQKLKVKSSHQVSQLPKTPIEKERFAYFFKDELTNLFNENYLDLLLKQNMQKHRCINLLLLHKFSSYNDKNGWTKGNDLLIYISKFLIKNFKVEEMFRFHGSNFLLLNDQHIDLDLEVIQLQEELTKYNIDCELKHIDINDFENSDMLKEYLNK